MLKIYCIDFYLCKGQYCLSLEDEIIYVLGHFSSLTKPIPIDFIISKQTKIIRVD